MGIVFEGLDLSPGPRFIGGDRHGKRSSLAAAGLVDVLVIVPDQDQVTRLGDSLYAGWGDRRDYV